jgi:hypothetical protein
MRRLVLVLACVAAVLAVVAPVASARSFTNPGTMRQGEYRYIENSDGSFTEYYQGRIEGAPIQGHTYSRAEMEKSNDLFDEAAVDEGTTGENGSIVIGSDGQKLYASERVVDDLRTGEDYTGLNEAEIGDEFIDQGVVEGSLPSLGDIVASAAGTLLAPAAVISVGVAVGVGIDELFGVPAIEDIFGGTGPHESETFDGVYSPRWLSVWEDGIVLGDVNSCEIRYKTLVGSTDRTVSLDPGEELCEYPKMNSDDKNEYEYPKGTAHTETYDTQHGDTRTGEESYMVPWSAQTWGVFAGVVPPGCPVGQWFRCAVIESQSNEAGGEVLENFWAPLFEIANYAGFPDEGLGKAATVNPTEPSTVPAMPKIIKVTPQPLDPIEKEGHKELREIPTPARTYCDEECKEEEGHPEVTPEEEGEPIPKPGLPEIPQIEGDELYTRYHTRLDTQGFTNVHETTLPETAIDPSVGPGDVAVVAPFPGSRVDPGTEVTVDVNPEDAPEPSEPGGGLPPPTVPEIKTPKLNVLCSTFPIGIPCWLVHTIEAWSVTEVTPEISYHFDLPATAGRSDTCMCGTVSAAPFMPVVEAVKPYMELAITIGVIIAFASWMMGRGYGTAVEDSGQITMTGPGF